MAHGFLRRIFEIFDRYETSVDMLSTSEVSVSLTLDNTENLDSIREEVRQFAEVTVEEKQAIVCLVGENIRHTPGIAGRAFQVLADKNMRMISQGASVLNLGFVIADSDLTRRCCRFAQRIFLHSRSGGVCLMSQNQKLAIVGYGKMGQLVEQLAPEYNFDVVLRLIVSHRTAMTPEAFHGVDVAIEFSTPEAAPENLQAPRATARRLPSPALLVGSITSPQSKRRLNKLAPVLVWSPNFSVGVAVFRKLDGYRGAAPARRSGIRRLGMGDSSRR